MSKPAITVVTVILLLVFIFLIGLLLVRYNIDTEWMQNKRKNYSCIANIKKIDIAIWNYLSRFEEFPDTLQTLVPTGYLEKQRLHCPACKKTSYETDYDYIGNKYKEGLFAIVCDKKGNHPGIVNVLMSDTTVLTVPDNKLEQAISEYINLDPKVTRIPYIGYPLKRESTIDFLKRFIMGKNTTTEEVKE